jgi:hypothetical protein
LAGRGTEKLMSFGVGGALQTQLSRSSDLHPTKPYMNPMKSGEKKHRSLTVYGAF